MLYKLSCKSFQVFKYVCKVSARAVKQIQSWSQKIQGIELQELADTEYRADRVSRKRVIQCIELIELANAEFRAGRVSRYRVQSC